MAKGLILEGELKKLYKEKCKVENKEVLIDDLLDKISLKIVYSKIERGIDKQNRNSEREELLNFFLNDPNFK